MAISWKGYTWNTRDGGGGPGFGTWSTSNVSGPDGSGYVTLSITNPSGSAPIGAEIINTSSLGYGTYTLVTGTRMDTLDKNIVFGGLFPYFGGSPFIEFDVGEISSWDAANADGYGPSVVYISHNSWYNNAASRTHSSVPIGSDQVHTFVLRWEPGIATYDTYIGTGTGGTRILHSVHTTSIPVPSTEVPIINLWVYNNSGTPNAGDLDAPATSIVLRDFTYTALSAPTPSDLLLQYNFTTTAAPTTTTSGVIGGSVTNQSLTSLGIESLGYAADPILVAAPTSGATSAAAAITNDSYLYFTITPITGKSLSLSTLTFNIARGGAATPRGYDVRSSADSYAATLGTAAVSSQRTTFTPVSIDLSGAAFQNLTTATTFRIYLYSPATTNTLDLDAITVNGTVGETGTAGVLEQEGFRFRSDNGSETAATWLAVQDVNITQPKTTNTRLRMILNSTNDRPSESYQLEYRQVGGTTWTPIA